VAQLRSQGPDRPIGAADGGKVDLPVFLIALLLTLLNALKPVTVDETAFLYYARQIASHPIDPYGFEIFWYDVPTPAMDLLAPAGLPYWLAGGIALFGEDPVLLKLWLFPYALLLVWSMRRLIDRFAPGGGTPLLLVLALAPAIVPAFNLMLDIPALSLGLGAFAVFISACERDQLSKAVLAGALAGLAMQTKYNAVAETSALVAYGLFAVRRIRVTVVSVGVAAALFVGWEAWLGYRYGESHLLHHLLAAPQSVWSNTVAGWTIGWVALLGALATPAGLLAISELRRSRFALSTGMVVAAAPLLLIATLEPRRVPASIRPIRLGHGDLALDSFFVVGLLLVVVVIAAVAIGWKRSAVSSRRDFGFLLLWLAIELLICFWMSPYHAARRLIGPIVVTTLLVAHSATRAPISPAALRSIAAFSVCIGLLFGIADLADTSARRRAQASIAQELTKLGYDPDRDRVWFTGHWGFQYESERRGYRPLIAGRSVLSRGDFVLSALDISHQALPEIRVSNRLARVATSSPFPFSTNPSFYQGAVPIRRQSVLLMRVRIHRVLENGPVPALPAHEVSRGSLLRLPAPSPRP